jgi:hypothetical protein
MHAERAACQGQIVLRCFPFQKRASFTELTLDLNDGLDLRTEGPLQFG